MKFILFLSVSALVFFISSCATIPNIEKRRYTGGFYIESGQSRDNRDKLISLFYVEKEKRITPKIIDTIPEGNDSLKILTISSKVGEVIDSAEKAKYKLFPFWSNDEFESAKFVQDTVGKITLIAKMKNGSVRKMPYSTGSYNMLAKNVFDEPGLEPVIVGNENKYVHDSEHRNKMNVNDQEQDYVESQKARQAGTIAFIVFLLLALISGALLLRDDHNVMSEGERTSTIAFVSALVLLAAWQTIAMIIVLVKIARRHSKKTKFMGKRLTLITKYFLLGLVAFFAGLGLSIALMFA